MKGTVKQKRPLTDDVIIDAVCSENDLVQLEVQQRNTGHRVVYVHINGITRLRLGRVTKLHVSVESPVPPQPNNEGRIEFAFD